MLKELLVKLKTKTLLKTSLPKGISNAKVLFVVDADAFDLNSIQKKFKSVFNDAYAIDVIHFTHQKKKINKELNTCFSKKDFSYMGNLSTEKLQQLVEQDYEYVFQFFSKEHLYLSYVSANTKANLRIGFQDVNPALTDLIFNINQNDLGLFFKEAKKYLEIIKKSA